MPCPLPPKSSQPLPIPPFAWFAFSTTSSAIDAGLSYVNVHTVANPAGEIRGQISALTPTPSASPAAKSGAASQGPALALVVAAAVAVVGMSMRSEY